MKRSLFFTACLLILFFAVSAGGAAVSYAESTPSPSGETGTPNPAVSAASDAAERRLFRPISAFVKTC
jgi:hypothetical protein